MPDFLSRLKTEVLIDNGEVTTDLGTTESDLDGSFQWWAINHAEIYQDAIKAYFRVGADVASTYTGGINRLTLRKHGLEEKTHEMNCKITSLAREVTPADCYLAFGIHSTDMFLPPRGDNTTDEVYQSYVEQIAIAEDEGADLFRIIGLETVQTTLAVKAIRENSKLPILGSFYFNATPGGFKTEMGIDPTTGARKLEELGVDLVGIICGGINYQQTTAILKEMRAVCSKHLAAKPDSDTPQSTGGQAIHRATPEEFADEASNWAAAGARLIGGCCGTTPEHIARLVAAFK